ncbi:MAG: TPM domain-containing protein [Clostridiales bacterium]|nr:TPM domain-containing protein [Clostridiales bacterium]
MKKIKLSILFILIINILTINIFATELIPQVDTSEKIYDFANIFNNSDEETIYDRIISSISSYNMDIIIVTIDDNPYTTANEFAKEFYLENNFGFSTNKNGILYLIDFDNLTTSIYANGNISKIYTNSVCSTINKSVNEYYNNDDYLLSAFTFLNNITLYSYNNKYNLDFDTSKKVYDYANLLTSSEEEKLYNLIMDYIDETNYDMAVVTINDNPKNSAMIYADDFYDYNGFGLDSEFSGILFLIDMDTREMWISTTGKCINAYTDSEIDIILDYTYDEISDKDYYGCAKVFIEKADLYHTSYGSPSTSNNYYDYDDDYGYDYDYDNEISFEVVVVFTIIITALFIGIATSKHKTAKIATQANAYARNFKITYRNDIYLRKNTTKTYDPPSSSSSSGGSSSRSSSHRSSSGRSHGGGGRRF